MPDRDAGDRLAGQMPEGLAESAQAVIDQDVARTAASDRLKKSVPRALAVAGRGCRSVVIVVAVVVLVGIVGAAIILTGTPGAPAPSSSGAGPSAAPSPSGFTTSPSSDDAGPVLTAPDPTGDTTTDSGAAVSDPAVDISKVAIQKVGDRYRVTVTLGAGFEDTFSFAVLLEIGSATEASTFIWQTHGTPAELLIGRIDPQSNSVLAGEAEGVRITRDPATGTVVFEFGADQVPAGTDRMRISSFHSPADGAERNRDVTDVILLAGIN